MGESSRTPLYAQDMRFSWNPPVDNTGEERNRRSPRRIVARNLPLPEPDSPGDTSLHPIVRDTAPAIALNFLLQGLDSGALVHGTGCAARKHVLKRSRSV